MAPFAFIPHPAELHAARLQQRRDRFLADVTLEATGEAAVAYCVNPGRMEAFSASGARIWLLPAAVGEHHSGRRLAWTWEMIEHDGVLCDTNTQRPNHIVRVLLQQRLLPGLDDWDELESERTLVTENVPMIPNAQASATTSKAATNSVKSQHKSRLDFWMRGAWGEHFIEVKNCHMVYPDGNGYFPDSISHRASRHMDELARLVAAGHRATAIFVVQRGDLSGVVRPSIHHDPVFASKCRMAAAAGVNFRALVVSCSLKGLTVEREASVDVSLYDPAPIANWVHTNRPSTGWIRSLSKQRVANGPFPHELTSKMDNSRQKVKRHWWESLPSTVANHVGDFKSLVKRRKTAQKPKPCCPQPAATATVFSHVLVASCGTIEL